jgi:predicted permease
VRPEGVLLFSLDPPRLSYPPERIRALPTNLQERIRAIPGVESAAFSGSPGFTPVSAGESEPAPTGAFYASSIDIGGRFFETMGIRILYGRAIDERDRANGIRPVVVNQAFARYLFHRENALGEIFTSSSDTTYQVVGVCADWHVDRLLDPIRPAFYRALIQEPFAGSIDFEVKVATGDEARIAGQIRKAAGAIDPKLVIADVHTELQQLENVLSPQRLMASLAEVFGALALLLASIGIYGVMAYAVARRTNEVGIRMALGAQPRGVAWMMLRETLVLAAAGIVIGVPAVRAASPVLDHFLAPGWRDSYVYGVKPDDPLILALAALVLASAALFAGYLPARRAARIDPMAALRHD